MNCESNFRRVLIKISGEALMGDATSGVDPNEVQRIAADIAEVVTLKIGVSIVIGGGNIFRGIAGAAQGMDRATADYMGMLATVINALALEHALTRAGLEPRVLSAIPMPTICEPYSRPRAMAHLAKGRVVIFAAGTGSPYFTTDTAAALRAVEMGCDAFLKATQVDGVYSSDPRTNPDAIRYEKLSYTDVLVKNLKVMDATAISLARESCLPCLVFSLHERGAFASVLKGLGRHTIITLEEGGDHG